MGLPKRHLKAVDGSTAPTEPWEQRFRLLAGSVRALVSVHDAAGSYTYASPLVSELTGVPRDTLLGSPVQALIHPDDGERVMALHRAWMRGPGAETVEYRLLSAGGGWCPVETTFIAGDGPEVQWITRRMDVVGAAPQTAAEIDPSTGLPTRFSLLDRLAWALHPAGSGAAGVVVVRVDGLDRLVEDRGRPATSLVLREIGRHINSALRPLDLVGQLDEERLAAICAGVDDGTTIARIAERILDVAGRPMGAGGLRITPSVGATCSISGQRRPAALIQDALQAADSVSERGGNRFEIV
ncbi:MAG TPA: diguanylate cyclase [Thermoleophilaceae bacterium]|nr:diguanylate cyclase [Thermoleophilaceae bacterium]